MGDNDADMLLQSSNKPSDASVATESMTNAIDQADVLELHHLVPKIVENSSHTCPMPIDIIVNNRASSGPDVLHAQHSDSDSDGDEFVEAVSEWFVVDSEGAKRRRPRSHTSSPLDSPALSTNSEDATFCFPHTFEDARDHAEKFVKRVWEAGWKAVHFYSLPEWLQDNDFLHSGHRPPLPSFNACFRSIFRLHTETGNIWTHMLGCAAFIGVAAYFLTRPHTEVQWQEKLVFSAFFVGAIACLGLSFAFHTVHCHSERVGKLFSKLDYCGITMLIMGSFVPWLFYGFYCRLEPKIVYTIFIIILGTIALIVSLWDKFGEPKYRPLRAGTFMALGLSGVVPAVHYFITDGFWSALYEASMGWLVLMAALYIAGAMMYALRVPERFFPGKCDLWFQSHQIFHLCVVVAAFVHYHGISEMAEYRLSAGSCKEQSWLRKHYLW